MAQSAQHHPLMMNINKMLILDITTGWMPSPGKWATRSCNNSLVPFVKTFCIQEADKTAQDPVKC